MKDPKVINFKSVSFPQVSNGVYNYPSVINQIANVIFIHSMHDYGARYAFMAKQFAERGVAFTAVD